MLIIRKMELCEAKNVKKIATKAFIGIEQFSISNPKEAMVAVMDDKIIGGIMIKYIETNGKKIGYFDAAFVDSNYHGQGVGGKLYEETTAYLWKQGCTAVSAVVKDDNVGSWKLLLNNGFCQISLIEGIRQLGLWQMILQYFMAPFFMCNGMELYLAIQNSTIKTKQHNSIKQITQYILINIILLFFAQLQNKTNFLAFSSAYVILLLGGVLFSYIGTLFTKKHWYFRLNSGGAVIVAFINALGGLYPMIGNWYPTKYEKTNEFKKAMGLTAIFEWGFIICMTIIAFFLRDYHAFFNCISSIGMIFLIYRIIAVYPFESYGGSRVYKWNKGIYVVFAMVSLLVVVVIGYM